MNHIEKSLETTIIYVFFSNNITRYRNFVWLYMERDSERTKVLLLEVSNTKYLRMKIMQITVYYI